MRREGLVRTLTIGAMSLGLVGFGDGVVQKNQNGNEQFAQGNYEEALKLYRDAQVERPDLPVLRFNVGNALYKQAKPDQALSEYQSALSSDEASVNAKAYYNIGNAFFKQGKVQEAIEAYKKSLEVNPRDVDAKFNLEMAQLRLQEHQQQEQQQHEQDEQKSKEQNEKHQEAQEGEQQKEQGEQKEQRDTAQQAESEQGPEDRSQEEPKERPEGHLSEEEARRILNALNDKEKEVQEQRRAKVARRVIRELDW